MESFPYTTTPGKLTALLEKMRKTGVPPKVTQKWLESIGFKTKNDRNMLPLLADLGFVDSGRKPTSLWSQYRGAQHGSILANAIRDQYSDLLRLHTRAWDCTDEELEDYFRPYSKHGDRIVKLMRGTFKALCKVADFDGSTPHVAGKSHTRSVDGKKKVGRSVATVTSSPAPHITLNVNVQLSLPESTDDQVYISLFKAMREHLLDQ